MLRVKRGQMRIIEAFIACGLVLIGYYIISNFDTSTSKVKDIELQTIGQNLLNTLEDEELFTSISEGEEDWVSSLKQIVSAILPPGVLYNISMESLLEDGSIEEYITNMESLDDASMQDVASVQGVYTFSYPLVQIEHPLLDIVLVMDRSGSMDDPLPGDPYNKIHYAKEAACNFVDQLNITLDKVGLVSFSTESTVDVDMTFDHDLVKQRINDLYPDGWTNMGGGISDSNSQFEGNGRYNATWVMILLSDGKANRPYDEEYAREYALSQAEIAHNLGVKIYTIGLGGIEDIDESLLREIQTDGYFYAPSAEDLDDIYQAIAEDLIYEAKYDVVLIQIKLVSSS